MTDDNTPTTDPNAPDPSPAAGPPADVGREPIDAPELTAADEAAEVFPAAEVLEDLAAPTPVPVADEVAPAPQPAPEAAEPVAELPPAPGDEPAQEPLPAPAIETQEPAGATPEPEPTPSQEAAIEAAAPIEVDAAEPAPPKKPRKSKAATAAATPAAGPDPAAATPAAEPAPESKKKWYVVKVQSGREDSIKAAIERKVKIEGLEEFFGQIVIPVEEYQEVKKVTEKKNGERVTKEKKVIKQRKKFPGYVFAEVEFNDRILYLFRETGGVGDFVGASQHRAPTPMTDREVQSMLTGVVDKDAKKKGPTKQVVKLEYEKGDKVKIRDGPFANMEGEVKAITEAKEAGETPKVTVEVTIFGRGVPVELDYWHVDKV